MIEGLGPATIREHVEAIRSDARDIDTGIAPVSFRRARKDAEASVRTAARIGARLLLDGEADYPDALHVLEHPPVALWVMGDIGVVDDRPTVSIVGTRDCTPYGGRLTREISAPLARASATIVSGIAHGSARHTHRHN